MFIASLFIVYGVYLYYYVYLVYIKKAGLLLLPLLQCFYILFIKYRVAGH